MKRSWHGVTAAGILLVSWLVSVPPAVSGLKQQQQPFKLNLPDNVDKILKRLEFHQIYDDDKDDAKPFSQVFFPGLRAVLTTLYGSVLILFAPHAAGQLHCLTMFRVTGQKRLEQAISTWRRNFLQAKFTFIQRAPSFLLVGRSILQVSNRILFHRRLVQITKQAKADGQVSPREARRLSKMHKQQIRNLKRDLHRLLKASTSVRAVVSALDVDDIVDIGRNVLFQFFAVLATNHKNTGLGSGISSWCLFLNLGGLLSDVLRRFGSVTLALFEHCFSKQQKPSPNVIRITGRIAMFGTAAGLVLGGNPIARRLNMALLSSAVVMRGLKNLVNVGLSWDDDDDDGIWPAIGQFLETDGGGLLMILLSTASMFAMRKVERDELAPPAWLLRPMHAVENGIHQLAVATDRIV